MTTVFLHNYNDSMYKENIKEGDELLNNILYDLWFSINDDIINKTITSTENVKEVWESKLVLV